MYNFLYAVFGFIMPKAEARYQKKLRNRVKRTSLSQSKIDPENLQKMPLIPEDFRYDQKSLSEGDDYPSSVRNWQKRHESMLSKIRYDGDAATTKLALRRSV
ncbi:hypothetical protein RSOLAG22IIIB_07739 [Rhizoctonia solani]|uniref:Uncharacterized protein n=1 Tax=Rhizoctonia solani TaxID=456999 RepID=A0A0K6FQ00_9AGAM|nr:hypothetical protein RSOLAG22IIIB_07739 [Rhizoctonia solani]